MSLPQLAQHMAAHGRGPDTMLMHVAPDEVARLQEVARARGGSLTINPDTGLVEAGFFSDIVGGVKDAVKDVTSSPVGALALGAALGPAGFGLASSSLMAGAMVGGANILAGGNLQSGLMAGLGAYGGSNLYGGLMGAGTTALQNEALNQSAAESARLGLSQEPFTQAAAEEAAKAGTAETAKAGLNAVTSSGGLEALKAGMPAGTSLYSNAAMAAAPFLATALQPKTEMPDVGGGQQGLIRPYTFNRTVQQPEMLGTTYSPNQDTSERMWFDDSYTAGKPYVSPGPEYKAATGGEVPSYAMGGLSDLGGYSDGGRMLKGPGDGMSDSIPAQIGGKQPARLADGEFVVPADVVSHLGNGSTDAGAKQLYKMMDKVRAARTGKKKQAPAVNPGKYMPA